MNSPSKSVSKSARPTPAFISIPFLGYDLDPTNRAQVSALIVRAKAHFDRAARYWINGNNSGTSEGMALGEERCDRARSNAHKLLDPLGIRVDYPGLYPSFTVKGYSEHDVESAVLAALGHSRDWLKK